MYIDYYGKQTSRAKTNFGPIFSTNIGMPRRNNYYPKDLVSNSWKISMFELMVVPHNLILYINPNQLDVGLMNYYITESDYLKRFKPADLPNKFIMKNIAS